MTTTDYQKQGADFMKATATQMKVKFSGHKRYFDDDRQSRDVFRITLKNTAHKYAFNFGQSIMDSTGNGIMSRPVMIFWPVLLNTLFTTLKIFAASTGTILTAAKHTKHIRRIS